MWQVYCYYSDVNLLQILPDIKQLINEIVNTNANGDDVQMVSKIIQNLSSLPPLSLSLSLSLHTYA